MKKLRELKGKLEKNLLTILGVAVVILLALGLGILAIIAIFFVPRVVVYANELNGLVSEVVPIGEVITPTNTGDHRIYSISEIPAIAPHSVSLRIVTDIHANEVWVQVDGNRYF
ncbi:MAG: hypothetical protein FWG65_13380 [Turicibacter sp.]|nr:hypothetical protein [Turicibacter sp.]